MLQRIWSVINSRVSIKVSINNPTRGEYLYDNALRRMAKQEAQTRVEVIEACLKELRGEDFVIFSRMEDEYEFVQFSKKGQMLVMDFPFSVIDKRSRLVHRLEYVLFKQRFGRKLSYWQEVAGNWSHYWRLEIHDYGLSIQAYCGVDAGLAARLADEIFCEVYGDREGDLDIKFDSWKWFWV